MNLKKKYFQGQSEPKKATWIYLNIFLCFLALKVSNSEFLNNIFLATLKF